MINDFNDGVEVNGALHFLSIRQDHILGFDLENEEWMAIRGPSGITPSLWEKMSLAELNGSLCIAHSKQSTVNLWLLTDGSKNVWIKAYTIKVGHVVDFVPLRVISPGGKLLFYYRRHHESVLQVYDPRSRKLDKAPTIIVGRIGLCSSRLDTRSCAEDLPYVDPSSSTSSSSSSSTSSSSSSSSSDDDDDDDHDAGGRRD
jgi:hypothetical protein